MDIKAKVTEIKNKAMVKTRQIVDWCKANPESAIAIASIVAAGGKYALKQHGRRANLDRQEELKTLFIYDRSHGHYWPLRRKLSSREYIEIDSRKDSGESLRDILLDMRVLK